MSETNPTATGPAATARLMRELNQAEVERVTEMVYQIFRNYLILMHERSGEFVRNFRA